MKSQALDLVRSAVTSAEFATAIEKLTAERVAVEASRPSAEHVLQDAVFAGKDEAKARAAIQDIDARAMMLKAAIDGGKRRLEEAEKSEKAAELKTAKDRLAERQKLVHAAATKQAEAIAAARAATAEMYDQVLDFDRAVSTAIIAGMPEQERPRSESIIRKGRGDIPRHDTSSRSVFAVRADRILHDILADNPFNRTRDRSVQDGRDGESRLARGMAHAAIKNQGAN